MASLLNRLIELEANRVVAEMRKEKPKPKTSFEKVFSYSLRYFFQNP